MAESEPKLEHPCPRCGTPHHPLARRCRHCYHDLTTRMDRNNPNSILEMSRPLVVCEACGKSNPFSTDVCLECGGDMVPTHDAVNGPSVGDYEAAIGPTRVKAASRSRRRHSLAGSVARGFAWATLLRVAAVAFLFWGVIDTSIWLTKTNQTLEPGKPEALQYTVFALYEVVRNLALVLGVWMLTSLGHRRQH